MTSPTPQWQLRRIVKTLERLAGEIVDPDHAADLRAHADGLAQLAEQITPAMRPDMLTPAQARVLSFIRQCITQCGHAPTRKELGAQFGFASPNAAQEHVRALERKGHITLTREARGIRVNERAVMHG